MFTTGFKKSSSRVLKVVFFKPVVFTPPGVLLGNLIGIPRKRILIWKSFSCYCTSRPMAPGQSELALENELFTQVSLLPLRDAYVFSTRKSFIIHRRSDGDFNASQLRFLTWTPCKRCCSHSFQWYGQCSSIEKMSHDGSCHSAHDGVVFSFPPCAPCSIISSRCASSIPGGRHPLWGM